MKTKLYLLEAMYFVGSSDHQRRVVVEAETLDSAREMAAGSSGREGDDVWLDPERSSCELLKPEGMRQIVIREAG